MQIIERYSHLNGWEHILVHKPQIWQDLVDVIAANNAAAARTKVSKEKGMVGKLLYSPDDLNKQFESEFNSRGWHRSITRYWVTPDVQLIRKTVSLPEAEQKSRLDRILFCHTTRQTSSRIESRSRFNSGSTPLWRTISL